MSQINVIAKPYAKAAFEYAREVKAISEWTKQLALLAMIVNDEQMQAFLSDTRLTRQQRGELLLKICGKKINANVINLIKLLTDNNRLLALPAIFEEYEQLRAEDEGTIEATVRSAKELPAVQQKKIIASLQKRLEKKVTLKCEIEPSLIGGAIIKAGDLVIDGTLKTRLNKLNATLLN